MSDEPTHPILISRRTAADLLGSGDVQQHQLHAAALALARLQDRGYGRNLVLGDMCEILGYVEPEAAAA